MTNKDNPQFDVVFGIDMETDIGSFTPFYEGVKHGTPRLLSIMKRRDIKATYFWTGHAAENNPKTVKQVHNAGHETGCHGLYHETLGDPLFPLPNNWPILPAEVEGRLTIATKMVKQVSGVKPISFRCPRLWGSTTVVNVLEKLGYTSDASLPLYFYRNKIEPYHPSKTDWTKSGRMKIVEIPNFCDLEMKSQDPKYQRDRDQWPMWRTKSAAALMKKVHGFVNYVAKRGVRPVVCFYFHPWEFYAMPTGWLDFGEARVKPASFITKNCGEYALEQFDILVESLKQMNARFLTCKELAKQY
ncbi:MAG: polysaccharide deacetylase family protein [Sedimentisphaerales bacterium]|nr:polysaccharide deacetylase family protein [Sedimentisphaerales bacterium]